MAASLSQDGSSLDAATVSGITKVASCLSKSLIMKTILENYNVDLQVAVERDPLHSEMTLKCNYP